MEAEAKTNIKLTESLAMLPAASVSGLYFGGKGSQYFSVGKICQDQLNDYAVRKKMDIKECEKWLSHSLNYEPWVAKWPLHLPRHKVSIDLQYLSYTKIICKKQVDLFF